MNDTSLSLLDRLNDSASSNSWDELLAIYRPLLQGWLNRYQVQPCDAEDLVQDVMSVLVRDMPKFQHNRRPGAFRNWLRTILANRLKEYWRTNRHRPRAIGGSEFIVELNELADGSGGMSRCWNEEHDTYLMQKLSRVVRPRFDERTWDAFHGQVIGGKKAADVAVETGLSLSSVYAAKSRVLHALRQESQGLIDGV